jgi:beta-glucosidase
VLLKNDGQLLPLARKGKIALVGPLADSRWNMAGMWSVAVQHEESVTVLEGFRNAVGDRAEIHYAKGCNIVDDPVMDLRVATRRRPTIDTLRTPAQLRAEAMALASRCDVVVAVMGEAAEMSGESSNRTDLTLPGSQRELLEALLKTGKPVVLVLFTGRPLILGWEQENIPAILNVWFGGTQSGNAIGDVIFGDVNPSGKLPVTFPQNVGQIPIYYSHKNTGRPQPEGEPFIKFRSNYLDISNEPLYPFGYGLSYARFGYSDLSVSLKQKEDRSQKTEVRSQKTEVRRGESQNYTAEWIATFTLTNAGNYDGAEVVQLYIRDLVGSITRPVKELKGFRKVFLKAGESREVNFTITTEELKFYNSDLDYDWEPGEFVIMVGGNSRDVLADTVTWE